MDLQLLLEARSGRHVGHAGTRLSASASAHSKQLPMSSSRPPTAVVSHADRYAQDAALQLKRGNLAGAEDAANFALALQTDHAVGLRVRGMIQRRRGQLDLAYQNLRAAFSARPDDLLARRECAACLADQGQLAAAIQMLECNQNHDVDSWFDLAVLHDRNADAASALRVGLQVSRLSPTHAGVQLLNARASVALGDIDKAAAIYRKLTSIPAQAAKAWFALLDLKTAAISEDDVRAMEAIARRAQNTPSDRMLIGFALGQAYEASGRFADAVRCFDTANEVRRRDASWDSAAHTRLIDATIECFREVGERAGAVGAAQPIFVLGAPRSGTTLVEQILAAHPEVVGASELPDLAQIISAESHRRGKAFPEWAAQAHADDWQRLGADYLAHTVRWQTGRLFTDKTPENWRYIGAIVRMLPTARIVICSREPVEILWSCYKQLFAPGHLDWSYDADSIAAYLVDCERLCEHFQRLETARCYTVSHENLLRDFQPQVERLLHFVGLSADPACLDFASAKREVRTASAAQVRRPLMGSTARAGQYSSQFDKFSDMIRHWRALKVSHRPPG